MSRVRTRVARSDWWASRNVVSVKSNGSCSRTHRENASAPISRNFCREPGGGAPGSARGARGSGATASPGGRATPGKPLTVISAAYVNSRIARFWRTGNRNSSGFSSMNRVVQLPARKSGLASRVEQERNVGLHPPNPKLFERPLHSPGGVDEPAAGCTDLHEQRVVERRDDPARHRRAAVDPDAQPAHRAVMRDPPIIGCELVLGVFRRHPALHRVALNLHHVLRRQVDLRIGKRLAPPQSRSGS